VRFIPIAVESEHLTEEEKECIPEEQLQAGKRSFKTSYSG